MQKLPEELKQWIPFAFYKKDEDSTPEELRGYYRWFADLFRSLFHLLLAELFRLFAILATLLFAEKFIPQIFLDTRIGLAIGYTVAFFLLITPFRIMRHPSYLLYRKVFKRGRYLS